MHAIWTTFHSYKSVKINSCNTQKEVRFFWEVFWYLRITLVHSNTNMIEIRTHAALRFVKKFTRPDFWAKILHTKIASIFIKKETAKMHKYHLF